MEQSKDLETIVEDCKPLTCNHETTKMYSALKQCMANNELLRNALNEAAETIQLLTEKLNDQHNL